MLESLFNKVAGPQACDFIKKRLQHRCFPVNIYYILKNTFFHRTPPAAASEIFKSVNLFHATGLFLYPLKISGDICFHGIQKKNQCHEIG